MDVPWYAVGFIYIQGKLICFCLLLPYSFFMYANNRVHYGPMVVFVSSLFCISQQFTLLYSRILKYSNYIMLASNIVTGVCQCIQLSLLWWFWECVYFVYHHHPIGSMKHLPLFRVRSSNNGMRCMPLEWRHAMETCPTPATPHPAPFVERIHQ